MKAIKVNALDDFMRQMYDDGRDQGVSLGQVDHRIAEQLALFCRGIRGAELHDNCIILLDGTIEVPE
jgi:hypothetical protein